MQRIKSVQEVASPVTLVPTPEQPDFLIPKGATYDMINHYHSSKRSIKSNRNHEDHV